MRLEERHPKDRPCDEFPKDVTRRGHHGPRMSIAEQSLDDHALRKRCTPAYPHRRRGDADGYVACGGFSFEHAYAI
jgi:hypothetical protein